MQSALTWLQSAFDASIGWFSTLMNSVQAIPLFVGGFVVFLLVGKILIPMIGSSGGDGAKSYKSKGRAKK